MKLIKVGKDSPGLTDFPCIIYNERLNSWHMGRALYNFTPKNGYWFYNDMSIGRGTHWLPLPKLEGEKAA